MKYVKAFVAGMILPAVVMPFIIAYFVLQGELIAIQKIPLMYFGALLWGVWNVIFIMTRKHVPITDRNVKLGAYGAVYGLISALVTSLLFEFTSVIPSFSDSFIVLAIIGYPILLYFAWKYVVNALNLIFEVY